MQFTCNKCGNEQYESCSSVYDQISDEDEKRLAEIWQWTIRSQADEHLWDNDEAERQFVIDRWIHEQNGEVVVRNLEDEEKHYEEVNRRRREREHERYMEHKKEKREFLEWKKRIRSLSETDVV